MTTLSTNKQLAIVQTAGGIGVDAYENYIDLANAAIFRAITRADSLEQKMAAVRMLQRAIKDAQAYNEIEPQVWGDFLEARREYIVQADAEGKSPEAIVESLNLTDGDHVRRILYRAKKG